MIDRDDIIRMAREAWGLHFIPESDVPKLERFAALVAQAEREACAKVCEELRDEYLENDTTIDADDFPWDAVWKGAIAIRARGEK